MAPDAVATAGDAIARHMEMRDRADLERDGAPPPSIWEFAFDIVAAPLGAFGGFFVAALLLQWPGWPWALAPMSVFALATLGAIRVDRVRRLALGAVTGLLFVAGALCVAVLIYVVRS